MNTIKKYGKVAITVEGDYNPDKSYSRLSFVDYNGLTYMSIVDNTTEPPSDGTQWKLISVQGLPGKDGNDGHIPVSLYTITDSDTDIPPVANNNLHPGSIWGAFPSQYSVGDFVWRIDSVKSQDGTELISDWTSPYLVTGVKGDKGDAGQDGRDGIDGAAGTNSYFHVKFADDEFGTNMNETSGEYIGTYVDNIKEDSDDTTKYTWIKITGAQGPKGDQGVPGNDGADGKTQYLHIAYSNSEDGTVDFSVSDSTNRSYIGQYVDFEIQDSTTPSDYKWTKVKGETGPQGATGPAGEPGGTGPAGVDGLPGVDFEVRYCLGGDATYNGTSNPSGDSPTGWLTYVPDVITDKPYIWCIQGRRTYTSATESTIAWGTPFKLSGTNGINGANGDKGDRGQTVYPAGIFDSSVTYTTDAYKAPYVLDPYDGNYYVLNAIGSWTGSEQNETTNSPAKDYSVNGGKYWLKFDKFEAIFAKIGIIANGLIGSVVFNGDYMFSQQGIDVDGNYSTNYENFMVDADGAATDHPYNSISLFRPNFFINCATGEASFGLGNIKISDPNGGAGKVIAIGGGPGNINKVVAGNSFLLKADGSGWLGFGNIIVNADGSGSIGANKQIQWLSDGIIKIGNFTVDSNSIYYVDEELDIQWVLSTTLGLCFGTYTSIYKNVHIDVNGNAEFAQGNAKFKNDGSGLIKSNGNNIIKFGYQNERTTIGSTVERINYCKATYRATIDTGWQNSVLSSDFSWDGAHMYNKLFITGNITNAFTSGDLYLDIDDYFNLQFVGDEFEIFFYVSPTTDISNPTLTLTFNNGEDIHGGPVTMKNGTSLRIIRYNDGGDDYDPQNCIIYNE